MTDDAIDAQAFGTDANSSLPDYEIAARDLRALIDGIAARIGLSMRCASLLKREGWGNDDKGAQHRQCVIEHKSGPLALSSIVVTYSAGSAIPLQWIERASKGTGAKYRNASGLSGLCFQYREALRMDGPNWTRKIMFQDLLERIRAAWNPDLFDVLSSCLSDCPDPAETFEDWANSLGYDTDSRKAESIFRECQQHGKEMRLLFGADFDRARDLASQL